MSSRSRSLRTPPRRDSRTAADAMLPLVYEELRRLAAGYLRRERPGHTLQATAIVHEAYLRLVARTGFRWTSRAHFTVHVAHMMRQILVDHARERGAIKRGGTRKRVGLTEALDLTDGRPCDLVALDDTLLSLEKVDPQKLTIIELHFFGGLKLEEIAQILHLSRTTVKREWQRARIWLYRELNNSKGNANGNGDGSAAISAD